MVLAFVVIFLIIVMVLIIEPEEIVKAFHKFIFCIALQLLISDSSIVVIVIFYKCLPVTDDLQLITVSFLNHFYLSFKIIMFYIAFIGFYIIIEIVPGGKGRNIIF